MTDYRVINGNSLDELQRLDAESVDACVTDPPYELGFMGKAWDRSGIAYNVDLWRQVYRVLKPGAYLLAFGGSRTYHRMACAIEDAGFEIRDQIQWIYGSGFPKSLDVSKAIDRQNGSPRAVAGIGEAVDRNALDYGGATGKAKNGLKADWIETEPLTDEAKQWDGWGTALKPAHEPICMARKPLEKGLTVAQNVLKWGTGAINIDKCRIEGITDSNPKVRNAVMSGFDRSPQTQIGLDRIKDDGRFPANVIHDGNDEVTNCFPEQASGGTPESRNGDKFRSIYGAFNGQEVESGIGKSSGSAARFFYSPKASKYDREAGLPEAGPGEMTERKDGTDGLNSPRAGAGRTSGGRNHHPTVKPTDLMQYLCRLVTPPGGLILDPFLGSGSTAKAALIERFRIIGIELNPEYAVIAEARCKQLQVKLF